MTSPTDSTSRVFEKNRVHLASLPAAFLATLGEMEWSKLSPQNRIGMYDRWKENPAPTALDRAHAEHEAKALHLLSHGGDVEIDEEGRITPPMTATERLRLHDIAAAESGVAPKRPAPPAPLRREDLPAQFRHLMGADLMRASDRVAAADEALAKLNGNQFLSGIERARLSDIVTMGGGGRVVRS